MYDKPNICKECGGKCCKALPGANFPSDFGLPDTTALESALMRGLYTIDCWEGDPRTEEHDEQIDHAYYVRPAVVGREGILVDYSWGGRCTFLTGAGCSLEADKRPLNCQKLEPVDVNGKHCMLHDNANKQAAAIAWLPYDKLLNKIMAAR